jgi:hypothetical protein
MSWCAPRSLYNHTQLHCERLPLRKPVQLVVSGSPPLGLTDDLGRPIDGRHDGQPGGNAVAVLQRGGATISSLIRGPWFVVRRGAGHILRRG